MQQLTSLGLRECHILEGASNFVPWKCKSQNLLEDFDLWGFVEEKVDVPTNPTQKHNKKVAKGKQIILDSVTSHFDPSHSGDR